MKSASEVADDTQDLSDETDTLELLAACARFYTSCWAAAPRQLRLVRL